MQNVCIPGLAVGSCLLPVPLGSVMARMLMELLRKQDGSSVTLRRCWWQTKSQSSWGMDIPVSGKALDSSKEAGSERSARYGLCHCRSDATLEARWKTASATLLHRLDTPAKERHTAFYHFIKYESFFVRENLWC